MPSFYQRIFDLSLAEAGVSVGLISGIAGIAGVILGGAISTPLLRRDPRWELWLPMLAYGSAAPLYAVAFLSTPHQIALLFSGFAMFAGSLGIGTALSAIQSLVATHQRTTAIALATFTTAIVGLGIGPLLVGALSDALTSKFAAASLRYALLLPPIALLFSALHFHIASRSVALR